MLSIGVSSTAAPVLHEMNARPLHAFGVRQPLTHAYDAARMVLKRMAPYTVKPLILVALRIV